MKYTRTILGSLALLLAVIGAVLTGSTSSPAEAASVDAPEVGAAAFPTTLATMGGACTSQQINMSGAWSYVHDDNGRIEFTIRERVYSFRCGNQDQFTDMYVTVSGCKGLGSVRVNPSPIAGSNKGEVRIPCGGRKVWPLYNKTYFNGYGDRCGHTSWEVWGDNGRTNVRCQA